MYTDQANSLHKQHSAAVSIQSRYRGYLARIQLAQCTATPNINDNSLREAPTRKFNDLGISKLQPSQQITCSTTPLKPPVMVQKTVGGSAKKSNNGDICSYTFQEGARLYFAGKHLNIGGKEISVPYAPVSDVTRNRLLSSLSYFHGKTSFVLEDTLHRFSEGSNICLPPYIMNKLEEIAPQHNIVIKSLGDRLTYSSNDTCSYGELAKLVHDMEQATVKTLFDELKLSFDQFVSDKIGQPIRGLFTYQSSNAKARHTDCIELVFGSDKKVNVTFYPSASYADQFLSDIHDQLPQFKNLSASEFEQETLADGNVFLHKRNDTHGLIVSVENSRKNRMLQLFTVLTKLGYYINENSVKDLDARTLSYEATNDCVPIALDQIFNETSVEDISQESNPKRGIRLRTTTWIIDALSRQQNDWTEEIDTRCFIPFRSTYNSANLEELEQSTWYAKIQKALKKGTDE